MDKDLTYLHGNHSKIAPGKNIVPRYLNNTVTQNFQQNNNNSPEENQMKVEQAKAWVDTLEL